MDKGFTKIGEHLILINCMSNKLTSMIWETFPSLKVINMDQNFDLEISIKDEYGIPFLNYEVEVVKIDNKILYRRADYLIEVDCEYKFASICVNNDLALKHALMNLYSSFIVYHNWGLLIHSSCAIENGQAHIFAGHSGAGKSTAAKLSNPRKLLSDEATIVKISQGKVTVFNSPFRSDIHSEGFEGECFLRSLNLLCQSALNKRSELRKSDSLIQLMDKVFAWPRNKEEIKVIIRLLTDLVNKIPVYDLYFQKNNTFWELIS